MCCTSGLWRQNYKSIRGLNFKFTEHHKKEDNLQIPVNTFCKEIIDSNNTAVDHSNSIINWFEIASYRHLTCTSTRINYTVQPKIYCLWPYFKNNLRMKKTARGEGHKYNFNNREEITVYTWLLFALIREELTSTSENYNRWQQFDKPKKGIKISKLTCTTANIFLAHMKIENFSILKLNHSKMYSKTQCQILCFLPGLTTAINKFEGIYFLSYYNREAICKPGAEYALIIGTKVPTIPLCCKYSVSFTLHTIAIEIPATKKEKGHYEFCQVKAIPSYMSSNRKNQTWIIYQHNKLKWRKMHSHISFKHY